VFLSDFARSGCGDADLVRCGLSDIGLQEQAVDIRISAGFQAQRPGAEFGRIA
jgi:hypothetical protein